jgi:flagellar hook-associated protein 3 FlgL
MGFVSLYSAFSDLQASQAGIDTASHNVSNAATPGYTSDQNAMNTAIGGIDTALDTVLQGLTPLGAVGRQIEIAQGRHSDEVNTVRSQLSQIEDVDRAEAVLELQMEQTAYETALAAFGRASRPSLVDFLR